MVKDFTLLNAKVQVFNTRLMDIPKDERSKHSFVKTYEEEIKKRFDALSLRGTKRNKEEVLALHVLVDEINKEIFDYLARKK